MEYFVKGRGALRMKKERSPKPTDATTAIAAIAISNAPFGKSRFPGIACGIAALDWAAAPPPDLDSGVYAANPLATLTRPELVSRFSRFKSARISVALW